MYGRDFMMEKSRRFSEDYVIRLHEGKKLVTRCPAIAYYDHCENAPMTVLRERLLALFQVVPPVERHTQAKRINGIQFYRRHTRRIPESLTEGKVHCVKQLEHYL